jgi:hypothetical protein
MASFRRYATSLLPLTLIGSALLVACGDDDEKTKTEDSGASKADASDDAGEDDAEVTESDAGALDAATTSDTGAAMGEACPKDLQCLAPSGRFLCTKPGPEVVACEKAADCTFGVCYKLAGQGICLQLCAPPEGLASELSVSGTVVELTPGKGITGYNEAPQEPVLAGVKVCVTAPATVKAECATTGADGKFTISKLPPNRNAAMTVNVTLSFEKAGYLPQLQVFGLGDGSFTINNQIRLMTTAAATTLATALGGKLPDATTGWLRLDAVRFTPGAADTRYSFVQGNLKLTTQDGVAISAMPQAGVGPFYTDADEQPKKGEADAGMLTTTASGHAYYLDVPAGNYQMSFAHATLTCGDTPIPAVGVPGFLFAGLGTACGNGVK